MIRPVLIFFLGIFLVSACAPAPKPGTAVEKPALEKQAALPVTVLAPGSAAPIANASSQPASGADPLLPELRGLISQRRADLLSRPGWLHVIARNSGARSSGGESGLSSLWGKVPDPWHEEIWLELDASGRVRRAVKRLLTEDLRPVQASLLVKNTWVNLTLGLEQPAGDAGAFDPNYGYFERVLRLVEAGHSLSKGTIYKECWYQGEQYSISDGVYKYEAVINPDKHALRWLKIWSIPPAPLALVDSKEILVEERVDQPPAEIQALLDTSPQFSGKAMRAMARMGS